MPEELKDNLLEEELLQDPASEEPQESEEPEKPEESPEPQEEPEFSLSPDGELKIREPEVRKQSEEKKYYSPDEIKELGIEKLDPNKIPPELVPFYKSMQADYTRKTQAVREREKELETLRSQPQPEVHPEQPQMTEQQARDLFFEAAKERAAALLGIKVEDFDEYDARHMSYLTVASQELYGIAQKEAERRTALTEKKRKYDELLGRLREEEPHYDEINQWASAYLEQLPYKEYSKYMRTFNEGTIEEIGEAIQQIRKAWYREKQGTRPKETPPKVETGSTAEEIPPKRMTTANFARMSDEEKADFLRTNGYV
jgi:hypothetical protein